MPAIRLLENQNIQYLRRQLQTGGTLQQEMGLCAERYLVHENIYDVILIEESDFRKYKKTLLMSGKYTMKEIYARTSALRNIQKYWVEQECGELISEMERCETAEKQLMGNVKRFLIRQGVRHISEIDYPLREQYEQELYQTRKYKSALRYLKTFDKIKQFAVQEEMNCFSKNAREGMEYREEKLFLPYLPNQKMAMDYNKVQNKHELVWDFARKAPEKLKRQVFQILTYILDNVQVDNPKEQRVRFLLPLSWLYDFCVEEAIDDIECMEISQIDAFEKIVEQKVVNVRNSMQIVDNSRKFLFLQGNEIHWHANVWYMERFRFSADRLNPSNPVHRLSFLEVTNKRSRELLQEYARYHLGIGGLTISNIRGRLNEVKKFLEYFKEEESICKVTGTQLDTYFKKVQKADIKDGTFNIKVNDIHGFYQYIKSKGYIKEIPFYPEYYLKKTYPVHNDRSVEEDIYMEILGKLHLFPVVPGLIFLNLWCTGLRVSEVCTLKGNAFYWDGEDAWVKVYQIKMKAEKMIPIPLVLYTIMSTYIDKNHIKPKDFIFKGNNGGAYRIGSFVKTFKYNCRMHRIRSCDYIFKSHDFRHTLATMLYEDGVSMQVIRDYLGHETEDMTKQYVDYMPKKVAEANEEYFENPKNSLASGITIKKRGDKK